MQLGSTIDPVTLFVFYTSKLTKKNNWLWQKPRRKIRGDDLEWYENVPVGPHPLENFMKRISEQAGLSQMYTNHCIRATVITSLDQQGFEARHIRAISGHKSDETIKSYSVRCPDKKKRQMSEALSYRLEPEQRKPTVTALNTTENDTALGTINFNDIVDFVPIANNANDFDIADLISEVAKEPEENPPQNVNVQREIASEQAVVPKYIGETQNKNQPLAIPNIALPNAQFTPPTTTNQTLNYTQANTFPLIPQMYFPNSSVTINYDITQPK